MSSFEKFCRWVVGMVLGTGLLAGGLAGIWYTANFSPNQFPQALPFVVGGVVCGIAVMSGVIVTIGGVCKAVAGLWPGTFD